MADLTESSRHLYHAEIDIAVNPGIATFTTPVWVPGSHTANGPVANITGIVFSGNGRTLEWRRDDVVMSDFHVTVPEDVHSVHVHLDALVPSRATRQMAMLEWESVLIYPAHIPVKDISIRPSVTVPAGWGTGTALTLSRNEPTPATTRMGARPHTPPPGSVTMRYDLTNVEQLEDSPVLTGHYFREYRLAPEIKPPHFLDIAGDEEADTVVRPETLWGMSKVVREARAEYGSYHYDEYHFLVTRSDYAGGEGGQEHGQSTNIGVRKKAFRDDAHQIADTDLFAHEFTHSWNGKYRRPAGLCQPDFATPVQSSLLWIYEGMTQYLGDVLATRAGLESQQQFREMLAITAASLDTQAGREWRSTEDTAIAVSLMRGHGPAWANWRRGKAYYAEGELLWLDVDTLIRSLTANRRSLDDFEKLFLGKGGNTGPAIVPYTLTEIEDELNRVAPYDWAGFLRNRVAKVNRRADLDGIVRGGYQLIYTQQPSAVEQIVSDPENPLYAGQDFWYSLGLLVDEDGTLLDVRWDSLADAAKLAPKQKIVTVNGLPYTTATFRNAIHKAKTDEAPIRLTLHQENETISAELTYHDGERFPTLVLDGTQPPYLDAITAPRVSQGR